MTEVSEEGVGQAPTPAAPRTINLDAARAARAEASREPVTLTLDGKDITLPIELPADFALKASEGDLRGAVVALLGDDADWFFGLRPSMDDLNALVEGAGQAYGMREGESAASPSS